MTVPIIVLSLLGVGTLVLSGGATKVHEEPVPASAAAAVAKPTPTSSDPEPDPNSAATPNKTAAALADTGAEPSEVATPNAEANADSTAEGSAASTPASANQTAPQTAPKIASAPKPKREPKPLSPAAQRRAERAAKKLRPAITDGRVKHSEENFVVAQGGGDASWGDATATCAALQVDGVTGWKLPSRAEARELQRGRALPSGAYWTRQRATKHDDSIYVHDTRTRRSSPWLDVEVAGVVCVMPRPRDLE